MGMKLVEFYPELQGRPESRVSLDMDARGPSIPMGHISGVMLQSTYTYVTYVNNYTLSDKTIVLVDAGGGAVTITLPTASANAGKYHIIKKLDSSDNVVIIESQSGELIDGEQSITLGLQYQYVMVCCSGVLTGDSHWHIIGGMDMKLEETVDRLLNEQIEKLEQLVIETQQVKLHLAHMSNAHISEDDVDG